MLLTTNYSKKIYIDNSAFKIGTVLYIIFYSFVYNQKNKNYNILLQKFSVVLQGIIFVSQNENVFLHFFLEKTRKIERKMGSI